ncbi:Uncharacterised protein [Vibrio cholerae]|uniref:Uncharacterized protein n=1 Tax=Vibrio cholerae TaxID=666 RepID=A0A655RDC3_VIBCL|nr:Uncharacterised protein [Vibrio cholerae]CSA06875.1 Uncharacterised protein [Vibrio cholerae]CSA11932.1 Uncharacterised protein [Vibrio cholerae]CSA13391.1 Uncharacterised protein [Vibrio cholerae]CSA27064.1 Uncharacterised protein [Vibrio cholerae]
MIKKPFGAGSDTFNANAIGRAVALCSTTVPMITIKVSGTNSLASAMPNSINLMANREEIEAATIPRGATQAKKAFSRTLSVLRNVEMKIDAGRASSCITTNSPKALQPNAWKSATSIRAASRINSPVISKIVKCSLKCKMC